MEVDKHINNVEKILAELKALGASRDEPILIIGGGVLADIAGFAMLFTIVAHLVLC